MAQKFFNQKVKKNNKKTIIIISSVAAALLILAIILIILINNMQNNNKLKNAKITIRDTVTVEVNEELPTKDLYFTELENVSTKDIKINTRKVKIKEVGKYPVTIKIFGKKFKTSLEVVDTKSPELTVKNIAIKSGDMYSAQDFIESCIDNSSKACIVEFDTSSINQDGAKIDYSNYKSKGTYAIKLIAKDESGNQVGPVTAHLTIGATDAKPLTCKFGSIDYDSTKHTMAINVAEENCALDLNLYKNEETLEPANKLVESETEKLQKEFNKINLKTTDIYLNSNIEAILNIEGTGIVGYSIFIEMSIKNSNNETEVIESFYLKEDGTREYIVNKYL